MFGGDCKLNRVSRDSHFVYICSRTIACSTSAGTRMKLVEKKESYPGMLHFEVALLETVQGKGVASQ